MLEIDAPRVRRMRPRARNQATPTRDPPAESTDELLTLFLATRDRSIRNELVERFRPLARVCAHQMRRRSEPLDDLEQVAMVGILKAIERFDPSFGVTFKTYASATAIGELRRHYRDHAWTLHVPRWLKDLHVRAEHAVDELTAELLRPPTVAETAARLGATVEHVLEALEARDALKPRSISGALAGVADADSDLLSDRGEDDFDRLEHHWTVEHLLQRLPARQRQIVTLRYFGDLTQSEIAARLGISQVHVSRLLRSSLARLRYLSRADAQNGTRPRSLCCARE